MKQKPTSKFRPFIGKGFNGKSLLVVGASFYCDKHACSRFQQCTTDTQLDSVCQYDGSELADEPTSELTSGNRTYATFANAVIKACGLEMTSDQFLERVSFTNYIQRMLPYSEKDSAGKTSASDLLAFKEIVDEIKPDMIVMWGSVISVDLKKETVDQDELARTRGYRFHVSIEGQLYTVLNTEHPANHFRFHSDENTEAIAAWLTDFFKPSKK